MENLPSFIKDNLKVDAMVSKNYFTDREFQKIDYYVVILFDQIQSRY